VTKAKDIKSEHSSKEPTKVNPATKKALSKIGTGVGAKKATSTATTTTRKKP
jgi:hypothetical protein